MTTPCRLFRFLFILAACVASGPTTSQPFPSKPIRVIVPYAPGGAVDIIARRLAPALTESLGQTVIVDNRPGAFGTIGIGIGMKSPSDGYTIVMSDALAILRGTRDFAPVIRVAAMPYLLVVHPSLPARSIREFISLLKARPGEVSFGSPGTGTLPHLAGELFMHSTGTKMNHVPYKGAGQVFTDLIAARIVAAFVSTPSAAPFISSGKILALGITSERRSIALPNVPTIAESGVPGFQVSSSYGIIAPRNTPREIVARLNNEIQKSLAKPEIVRTLTADGYEIVAGTPEALSAQLASEATIWRKLGKSIGVNALCQVEGTCQCPGQPIDTCTQACCPRQ